MSADLAVGDYFERVAHAVDAVLSGKLSIAEAVDAYKVLKATVLYKVRQKPNPATTSNDSAPSTPLEVVNSPVAQPSEPKRSSRKRPDVASTPKSGKRLKVEPNETKEKSVEDVSVVHIKTPVISAPNRVGTRNSSRQVNTKPAEFVTNGCEESPVESKVKPIHFPLLTGTKIPRKTPAKPVKKDNNDNQQDYKAAPADRFVASLPTEPTVVPTLTTPDVAVKKESAEVTDAQPTPSGPQIKLPKTGKDPNSMLNEYLNRQSTLSTLSALTGTPRVPKSPSKFIPVKKSDRKKMLSAVETQLKATVDLVCAKCSRVQKENIVQCLIEAASQKANDTKLARLARSHNAPLIHVKNCWAQLHPANELKPIETGLTSPQPLKPPVPPPAEPLVQDSPVVHVECRTDDGSGGSSKPLPSPTVPNSICLPEKAKTSAKRPRVNGSVRKSKFKSPPQKEAIMIKALPLMMPKPNGVGSSPLAGLMNQIQKAQAEGSLVCPKPMEVGHGKPFNRRGILGRRDPFLKWFLDEKKKVAEVTNGLKRAEMMQKLKDKWTNMTDAEKAPWTEKPKSLIPANWRNTGAIETNGLPVLSEPKVIPEPSTSGQPTTLAPLKKSFVQLKSTQETFASLDCVERKSRWALDPSLHTARSRSPVRDFATDAMDVAGHFRILGQTMTNLAETVLAQPEKSFSTESSFDLLLDSFWCSLGPLTCLTQYVAEMNGSQEEDIYDIIDNSACLMPL